MDPSTSSTIPRRRVDFTKIENLIAKDDEPAQIHAQSEENLVRIPYPTLDLYIRTLLLNSATAFQHLQNSQKVEKVPPKPVENKKKQQVGAPKLRHPTFTQEQLRILNTRFSYSRRIKKKEIIELAEKIGLTPIQIEVWFANRQYDEEEREMILKARREENLKKIEEEKKMILKARRKPNCPRKIDL